MIDKEDTVELRIKKEATVVIFKNFIIAYMFQSFFKKNVFSFYLKLICEVSQENDSE